MSPQLINTTISWTATANGGAGGISGYEFEYTTDGGNTVYIIPGCGYSASNICDWIPSTADSNYQIRVKVSDNAGGTPNETIGAWTVYPIDPPATIDSLTPDKASPQVAGTTITWTASASGGAGGIGAYRFESTMDGGVTVELIPGCDYNGNICEWRPTLASPNYQVRVNVLDNAGGTPNETVGYWSAPYAITEAVAINSLTPDKAAPQVTGTTITWTASASGGAGGISGYEFEYTTDGGTTPIVIPGCGYSASNICEWVPAVADPNYQVRVKVKDNAGGTPNETIGYWSNSYNIELPVQIIEFISYPVSPQVINTTIVWAVDAMYGAGAKEYAFTYKRTGVSETTLCDYSTDNTCEWVPSVESSSYQVRAYVRDQAGNITPTAWTVYPIDRITAGHGYDDHVDSECQWRGRWDQCLCV